MARRDGDGALWVSPRPVSRSALRAARDGPARAVASAVAERLEAGYGSRAREMAGELALHFERGQDARRAVQYQQYAAEQALSRSAYTEALAHCHQGPDLLATLPASPERASQELTLRLALSIALVPTQGQTSEALAHNLQQAISAL